ncbi:hypothetical protein BH23VER1_BH23VER1_35390 [soil metagenome]
MPLDRPVLAAALATAFPDSGADALQVHEMLGSTSDEAAALARAGAPEGTTVFAESQSAGRGRRGAPWVSTPRANLLFSVVLRPAFGPHLWPRLTQLAGLALADAIEQHTGLVAALKWPNDIHFANRKVAGILLDAHPSTTSPGYAVAGIGLNVNMARSEFPPELQDTATSLALETGCPLDRSGLAAAALLALGARFRSASDPVAWSVTLRELIRRSMLYRRVISAELPDGRRICGLVTGLGPQGELLMTDPSGGCHSLASAHQIRLE